jgi:hypothetical protein
MGQWLDPVARAFDARREPIGIFFRNDDAGWEDEQLFALLHLFEWHGCPIDLAAIPASVRPELAKTLINRLYCGASIGLHQHGFMHLNHEPAGRPCEFGPSRSAGAQRRDIDAGRRALLEYFGRFLDPFFTPPWNRCTSITEECIRDCGLTAISRDRSAGPVTVNGLADCSIGIDWLARARGDRLTRAQWGARMAEEVARAAAPLGVMLHHAQMDRDELAVLDGLLKLCRTSSCVRPLLMRDVVAAVPGDGAKAS